MLLALDALVSALCCCLAFLIRFEGHVPSERVAQLLAAVPVLVLLRTATNLAFGLHRWSFRLSGLHEAARLVQATLLGSAVFVSVFYFLQRATEDITLGPPRSVILIELLLTTAFMGLLRFSPRLAREWDLDRRRGGHSRVRTIVVGAGSSGELLLRDLQRSDEHAWRVVGFVDDDSSKWGTTVGGRPVLGPLERLPELVRRRDVRQLLFAIPRLPARRLREVLDACAGLKLTYKTLPVSFAYLADRLSMSMLQDLAPEDLLARRPVPFDAAAVEPLVRGRRLLVTGAGGSIGSEICRQLAVHGPEALTLVDVNESALYLLYRHLQQQRPGLRVAAEVADVRDGLRLEALVREHGPQDVFHAAANKHVPLMEAAPEEAVKTNVLGCRLAASIAHGEGVERFVLISTDKAVRPAGAMGASKRLAELVVREQAARSRTEFTVVRFGNVLGSAGSVVPLFKSQIAAGGPVTVTDARCRRYLMTLAEAVGMVLEAGLRHYGDVCVLEMGEPIGILDLARLMIAMSGFVPDEEIPIAFTGLRPGEKLEEELITAEEARKSREVRPMLRAIETDPPPPGFLAEVLVLEDLARMGDRRAVRERLHALAGAVPADDAERAVLPRA